MQSQIESDSENTSSDSDEEEVDVGDIALEAFISKEAVEENYVLMGKSYTPEKSPLVLSDLRLAHPEAFSLAQWLH